MASHFEIGMSTHESEMGLSFGQSLISVSHTEMLAGEWSIPDNRRNEASTATLKTPFSKVVILELCFKKIPQTFFNTD
jgi:hypothetical protein